MFNMFVNVGLNNIIATDKIISITSPDSASAKRIVQQAKADNNCVDCCKGKKIESVIMTTHGVVVLSPVQAQTLVGRIEKKMIEMKKKIESLNE